MVHAECEVISVASCPSRLLLDEIADKWSVLVLAALQNGPLRFNAIRRRIEGITQKALTQCLRRLERNGIVERRVLTASPVAVEYRISALGRTLDAPFHALYSWTYDHLPEVERAAGSLRSSAGRASRGRRRPLIRRTACPTSTAWFARSPTRCGRGRIAARWRATSPNSRGSIPGISASP